MYFVYLLENKIDKSWYIGFTTNLKNRLKEHLSGLGDKTTSSKKQWKLIYFECYLNKIDALGREKFLKSGSGRKHIKKHLYNFFSV